MRKLARLILALAASAPLMAMAATTGATYGHPNANTTGPLAYVDVKNNTADTFIVAGTYIINKSQSALPISPAAPEMYFPVDYQTNPCVEVAIVRVVDHAVVTLPNPLCGTQWITINPGANGSADALPVVTINK